MRILLVHQYFKTPGEGGGIRTWHIAKSWVNRGHEVKVLTAGSLESKNIDGIEIEYFPIPYDNSFGFFRRVIAFIRFVVACKKALKRDHHYDLAYVLTTPLTTAYIALHLRNKFQIPYVFEVGDLWPKVPVELGIIKNNLLKKYLFDLEKRVYKRASKLVALSPSIREYMSEIAPESRITTIPNMSDCAFFQPHTIHSSFSHLRPLRICYTGAVSYANHLEFLLSIAEESNRQQLPVEFHILGFGGLVDHMQSKSKELENVFWHSSGGMLAVKELIESCDASYISYLDNSILDTGSPNKFFDGLAAGNFIILNFEGWLGELIYKHRCGFSYDPRNTAAFIEEIKGFLNSPEKVSEYRQNARDLAEKEFSVPILTNKLADFLEL